MKHEKRIRKARQYHERFDSELRGEYIRLSEYAGSHESLMALHIPCGKIRVAEARRFFNSDCPVCAKIKARRKRAEKAASENVKTIESKYNVTALSQYKGPREPMIWRCNNCGEIIERPVEYILWRATYGMGMQHDCYYEHKRLIWVLKERIKQIEKEAKQAKRDAETQELCDRYKNNGYRIISVDDNASHFIVLHEKCGNVFESDRKRMKGGYGCSRCAHKGLSFGVIEIIHYLEDHHINFDREVRFKDCKRERSLPFDFIIYNEELEPTHAIEFNGEQHYRPTRMFGGQDKLIKIKDSERIKTEWCKKNGIPLLFVRYDEDIEEALDKFLGECTQEQGPHKRKQVLS